MASRFFLRAAALFALTILSPGLAAADISAGEIRRANKQYSPFGYSFGGLGPDAVAEFARVAEGQSYFRLSIDASAHVEGGLSRLDDLPYKNDVKAIRIVLRPGAPFDFGVLAAFPNLEILDIWSSGDRDLSGVEKLPHLRSLDLFGYITNIKATSLAPLALAPNLERLRIKYGVVNDLSAANSARVVALESVSLLSSESLGSLSSVERLSLIEVQNAPSKIDFGSFNRLTTLQIDSSINASNLSKAPALEWLSLYRTGIDFSEVAKMRRLRRLLVTEQSIVSLEPAAALSDLEEISLKAVSIADEAGLGPLARAPRLRSLTLDAMVLPAGLGTLGEAGRLENLGLVNVVDGAAVRFAGIERHTALRGLKIYGSGAFSLDRLADLGRLERLEIELMRVPTLDGLERLSTLKRLKLHGPPGPLTQYPSLVPLSALTELESLDLFRTEISSLKPLETLASLKDLILSFSSLKDLDGVGGMPQLTVLRIDNTLVSDLGPLADHPRLERLDINKTRVRSLSVIPSLRQLRDLSLSDAPIRDYSPLQRDDLYISCNSKGCPAF